MSIKTYGIQSTVGWLWNTAKYYAQTSYYMAYVYGKVRALAQPLISTDFNINHIEGGVYICDIASAYNEDELKELGITHIVTAVLAVGPKFPDSFEYMCVPVRDIESEDIYSHLDKTTKFINDAVESGGKVAVHCICGVSRSATIVAAWVMSRHGYSVKETIEVLQSRRECVDPNPSFRKQLETFHADLSK
jgi:protein-tyrosine phosphatase